MKRTVSQKFRQLFLLLLIILRVTFSGSAPLRVFAQEAAATPEAVQDSIVDASPSSTPQATIEPTAEPTESPSPMPTEQATPKIEIDEIPQNDVPNPSTSPESSSSATVQTEQIASEAASLTNPVAEQPSVPQSSNASASVPPPTEETKTDTSDTMSTGDAVAIATSTTTVNTTAINSTIASILITILPTDTQDIDLRQLWVDILTKPLTDTLPDSSILEAHPAVTQTATVSATVRAEAQTGMNTASSSGSITMQTGDAYAVATAQTIANNLLLNSKVILALLNIIGDSSVNIIVPRQELLSPIIANSGATTSLTNEATITQYSTALASSGGNTQQSDTGNTLNTGNAYATSTSIVYANIAMQSVNAFSLDIVGSGSSTIDFSSYLLPTNASGSTPIDAIHNEATISTSAVAVANTGENSLTSVHGQALLNTGDAYAIATNKSILNSTFIDSLWFSGLISIAGNWSGKIIVAYPELSTLLHQSRDSISLGDDIEYTAVFSNAGYDDAKNTTASLTIPNGFSYSSDTCDGQHTIEQHHISWKFGTLEKNGSRTCTVRLHLDSGSDESSVTLTSEIFTSDQQTTTADDVSSVTTSIRPLASTSADEKVVALTTSQLFVSAANNVNGFVYPGDTIIFSLQVRNLAGVKTDNVELRTRLYTQAGKYIGEYSLPIGDLSADQTRQASFSLRVPQSLSATKQFFVTSSDATGTVSTGAPVESNIAQTNFTTMPRHLSQASVIQSSPIATASSSGQILGMSTDHPDDQETSPWLSTICFSTFAVLSFIRLLQHLQTKELTY